ncbi:NAD(P)-binding protein [Thozetella sp. PMI_491]|nr:NAD(P)-binding protein [Thozetella sp. PMI_491]
MSKPKGTIVITGANGGLGSALVSQIVSSPLGREYHGVYTVRNPKTADALRSALGKGSAHKHDTVALDLASLASVREVAADINSRVGDGSLPPIRTLILNAAFQDSTRLTMTSDGFEMSFQVNHLSHFLFTLLLLQSMDKTEGRIVVVGSWSHDVTDPQNKKGTVAAAYNGITELFTDTEALAKGKWSNDPDPLAGYRRYGATKLCEVMFMNELQARIDKDPALSNISVLGVDPGGMGTGLLRNGTWMNRTMSKVFPVFGAAMVRVDPNGLLRTTTKSAADVLRAAFNTDEIGTHPRALYLNGNEKKECGAEARDEKKREMLWQDSVRFAQLQEGETVLKNWM